MGLQIVQGNNNNDSYLYIRNEAQGAVNTERKIRNNTFGKEKENISIQINCI